MLVWRQGVGRYLVLLVRVEQEDIDSLQLLDVAVSLELLSHLCADGRNGHVERVHLLDLGSLRGVRREPSSMHGRIQGSVRRGPTRGRT